MRLAKGHSGYQHEEDAGHNQKGTEHCGARYGFTVKEAEKR